MIGERAIGDGLGSGTGNACRDYERDSRLNGPRGRMRGDWDNGNNYSVTRYNGPMPVST